MRALTMMALAMMTKVVTQVGHPQASHLNHLNRLNLRLKGDSPGADHRHHLEHNSNNNSHSNHLQMFFTLKSGNDPRGPPPPGSGAISVDPRFDRIAYLNPCIKKNRRNL